MRVPKKADRRILIREAGGGGELIEHVTPALRPVERGVNDGEIGHHARVFQVPQPLPVFGAELGARPIDGLGGGGVEPFEMFLAGAILVVIPLYARHVHGTYDVEALLGIGVVADDIAQAGVMGHLLFFTILQHHLERVQIAVDVGYDGKLHFKNYRSMANPLNPPLASSQNASSLRILAARPAS